MKRIYIAGAITPTGSGNHAIEFCKNVRAGIKVAIDLIQLGYLPFCPMLDYQFFMTSDVEISLETIQKYSLGWLEACDAMLGRPGWEDSAGTRKEIEFAQESGIPVYFSIIELRREL